MRALSHLTNRQFRDHMQTKNWPGKKSHWPTFVGRQHWPTFIDRVSSTQLGLRWLS